MCAYTFDPLIGQNRLGVHPTHSGPVRSLIEARTVVSQILLDHHKVRTVRDGTQEGELSHVLLLNLVTGKVTFLVILNEGHGVDEGVNFLTADTFIVLRVVELLGALGGIRARDRVATEGNIVVPVAQNGGELAIGVLVNPCLLYTSDAADE